MEVLLNQAVRFHQAGQTPEALKTLDEIRKTFRRAIEVDQSQPDAWSSNFDEFDFLGHLLGPTVPKGLFGGDNIDQNLMFSCNSLVEGHLKNHSSC